VTIVEKYNSPLTCNHSISCGLLIDSSDALFDFYILLVIVPCVTLTPRNELVLRLLLGTCKRTAKMISDNTEFRVWFDEFSSLSS